MAANQSVQPMPNSGFRHVKARRQLVHTCQIITRRSPPTQNRGSAQQEGCEHEQDADQPERTDEQSEDDDDPRHGAPSAGSRHACDGAAK